METIKTILVWGEGLDWGRCRGLMGKGYIEVILWKHKFLWSDYVRLTKKTKFKMAERLETSKVNNMWAEAKAIKMLWRKVESRFLPLITPTLCCSDRGDALEWRHIPGLMCMGGYSGGGSWYTWLLVMVTALIGCAHALHRDNILMVSLPVPKSYLFLSYLLRVHI